MVLLCAGDLYDGHRMVEALQLAWGNGPPHNRFERLALQLSLACELGLRRFPGLYHVEEANFMSAEAADYTALKIPVSLQNRVLNIAELAK